VAEGGFELIVLQEKGDRHALDIAGGTSDEIALHPSEKHAVDAFTVEILAPLGAGQSKGFVEFAIRIAEAREIVEFIRSEKFGGALFGAQVQECDLRAFGFDLETESG